MTAEEIKAEIAAGGITAISLDTQVFQSNGNRLEHGALSLLKQFQGTSIRFVLSDVVAMELKSHIESEAREAAGKLQTALREVGKTWQISKDERDQVSSALFDEESAVQMTERRFEAFLQSTDCQVIASQGRVDVGRLLDDYFGAKPPFGSTISKKSEFPDSIALQSLESWAEEENTKILVVSKDGDWRNFCTTSGRLVCELELSDALSYFHQNAEFTCARLSQLIRAGELDLRDEIVSAAEMVLDRVNFIPEAYSGYFYEADVDEFQVVDFEFHDVDSLLKPVNQEEGRLVAEVTVTLKINVTSTFSFSIEDPIDKDEVPMGSATVSREVEITGQAYISFEGDLASGIEVNGVEVEFEDRSIDVDFGDVGPDWQDYQE